MQDNMIHFRAMKNYKSQFHLEKYISDHYHNQLDFNYLIQMNFCSIITRTYCLQGPKLSWHPFQKLGVTCGTLITATEIRLEHI